jgi:hypothetical protein
VKCFRQIRSKWVCLSAVTLLVTAGGRPVSAQTKIAAAKGDPSSALVATLSAACRRDDASFATHLTSPTAAVFHKLPEGQRGALMGRLAMLNDAGNVLLSNGADGRTVLRCDANGTVTELHLGVPETFENLSFVPVEARVGKDGRTVRFGLVRESGDWRLISVGLLLLDLPAMSQEWAEAEVRAGEASAVAALHEIADALDTYRRAFDRLPESLSQLGPAPKDGLSPDHANLLDESLSSAQRDGYSFRYVIVPADNSNAADDSERDKQAGFVLAATPLHYGQGGLRSFYLDSAGTLRGADKKGAVATSSDPIVTESRL